MFLFWVTFWGSDPIAIKLGTLKKGYGMSLQLRETITGVTSPVTSSYRAPRSSLKPTMQHGGALKSPTSQYQGSLEVIKEASKLSRKPRSYQGSLEVIKEASKLSRKPRSYQGSLEVIKEASKLSRKPRSYQGSLEVWIPGDPRGCGGVRFFLAPAQCRQLSDFLPRKGICVKYSYIYMHNI